VKAIGGLSYLMDKITNTIEIRWQGPFSWPKFEDVNNLPPIPKIPGVYLQTFQYRDGYLIYAAGITTRTVPTRYGEHTRKYKNGEYNVLDIASAQQGRRKEIWNGWGYAREHRAEFEERNSVILDAVNKQLAGFCIFVADIGREPRVLKRVEAAIMENLYQQPSPICDIPDRGMNLSARWNSENPIIVKNSCPSILYGLPTALEI
jgi:hypothetical protein